MASVPILDVNGKEEEEPPMKPMGNLIGPIPSIKDRFSRDERIISEDSYKHSQQIVARHYFLGNDKTQGNEDFLRQISQSTGLGQFDYIDAIRSQEHLVHQQENLITLPKTNTLELQWNHSLVRKRAKSLAASKKTEGDVRSRFDYREVAFLNISQGYDLNQKYAKTSDKLTRLSVETGLNHPQYRLRGREYYFYSRGEHIFNLDYTHKYDWGDLSLIYSHDSLSAPTRNFSTLRLGLYLTDAHKFYTYRSYDFEQRQSVEEDYGVLYTPSNDCWMLDLKYEKDILDERISVNFLINFNENNFRGLGGT